MMLKALDLDFSHIKGDFLGGITAGIVALPMALAFGLSSGLGPSAGIYGAIFISFFAALFGGTSTQISGPTAPMTAVSMIIIAEILAKCDGILEKALPLILLVFLLAGIMQILLGIMGLGKYIKYIPYPVVSGFMTAIGVVIIFTQILPSMGYYPKEDATYVEEFKPLAEELIFEKILKEEVAEELLVLEDFQETIRRAGQVTQSQISMESQMLAAREANGVKGTLSLLPRAIKQINLLELMLALSTVLIIFGFRKITRAVPSTLVALFVVSIVAHGFKLPFRAIEEIPSGFPMPQWGIFTEFSFTDLTPYLLTALTLAFLGAIDSLLTSVVADNMTKTVHKPNKELIGQGIGNSIAAIFGGIPGAGATIGTVINIKSGGVTRLSGMISGLLLFIIMLAFAPIASKIPAAVLSGILITVGISVMDYKGLKAIPHMHKPEVVVMIIVLVLSVFWNLVYAVGVGLVIASLMFMKKIGDLTAEKSEVRSLDEIAWSDEKNFPSELKEKVFIKHINGPLFFGFTSEFQSLASHIPETASTVIIRAKKMDYMDQTGLYAMEDVVQEMLSNNIFVLLSGVNSQPRYMMERIKLIPNLIPRRRIFDDLESCIVYIKEHVEDLY